MAHLGISRRAAAAGLNAEPHIENLRSLADLRSYRGVVHGVERAVKLDLLFFISLVNGVDVGLLRLVLFKRVHLD